MKQRSVGQGLKAPSAPPVNRYSAFGGQCQVQLEEFRKRLRESRLECGVSQSMLGLAIGTTGRHIGHLESGDRSPSLEEAIAIDLFFRRRSTISIFKLEWT